LMQGNGSEHVRSARKVDEGIMKGGSNNAVTKGRCDCLQPSNDLEGKLPPTARQSETN
jgi:hypothetical protein